MARRQQGKKIPTGRRSVIARHGVSFQGPGSSALFCLVFFSPYLAGIRAYERRLALQFFVFFIYPLHVPSRLDRKEPPGVALRRQLADVDFLRIG